MPDITQDWTQAPQAWQDYAKSLPELPDTGYNALREKFFQEHVMPAMLKQGADYSPEKSRQAFMEKTERSNKATFPRAELAVKTALAAATAPAVSGLFGEHEAAGATYFKSRADEARREAEKQGVGTTLPEMAGEMIGQAPYWAAGMGAAGALGKEMAVSKAAQKLFHVAAGGIIQGGYDAAKAEDGHRITEGLSGAAWGAGGVGVFEAAGPLRGYLKSVMGLSGEEAAAVEATTKGHPTPKQEAMAANVMAEQPEMQKHINDWLTEQVKSANRNGVPKDGLISEPGSRVKIQMTGADGKPYNVGGFAGIDVKDLPAVVQRIGQHLEKGGVIASVKGDPAAINDLYRQFEIINRQRGEYSKLPVELKGQSDAVVPTANVVASDELPATSGEKGAPVEAEGPPPPAESPGVPETKEEVLAARDKQNQARMDQWAERQKAADETAKPNWARAKGAGKQLQAIKGGLGPEMIPQLDRLEVLASGRVRDKLSGDIYKSVQEALQTAPPKFAYGDPNQTNYWISSGGKIHKVNAASIHEEVAASSLTNKEELRRGTDYPGSEAALAKGYVRVSSNNIQTDSLTSKGFNVALDQAIKIAEALGDPEITIEGPTGHAVIPIADIKSGENILRLIGRYKNRPLYGAEGTPAPEGNLSYKETSTAERIYGPGMTISETARASGAPPQMLGELQGSDAAKGVTFPGTTTVSGKPLVILTSPDRSLMFHEMTHAHIYGTGLGEHIENVVGDVDPLMTEQLQHAFSPEMRQVYGGRLNNEELYTYSATAVRTDDQGTIHRMADADGGRETFLQWVADATNNVREKLAEAPDSAHKRIFERKLNEVNRRASGYLHDISTGTFDAEGLELSWQNGKYITTDVNTGEQKFFRNRTELADYLDTHYSEPLTTPNLADESSLPPNTPKFAANMRGYTDKKPPIHTDPTAPSLSEREPAKGGMSLAWRYFQPFQDWIDTVARKNQWPELADLFGRRLQNASEGMEDHIYVQQKGLKQTLGQFSQKRQTDLFNYLAASSLDRSKVATELHITQAEKLAIEQFESQMSPLADLHGSSVQKFVQDIAPLLKAQGYDLDQLNPRGSITKADVEFWKPLLERGQVDPNDTNLLRVADTYVRQGARQHYLKDVVSDAEKFLKQRNAEGDRVIGELRTPLERHLNYVKGMPDYTTTIINSSLNHAAELINSGITQVNKGLPSRFQIEPIETGGQDLLSKWILFSYAGAIGLRPALAIRSALQMFITGYPILGGRYLGRGIAKVFEGKASEMYQAADAAGWLLRQRDYGNLYSGEGGVAQGMAKVAQHSLAPIMWSHNAARLVVGYGHMEKFLDAMRFVGDEALFLKKSNLDWLPKFKQDNYLKEVASGADSVHLARRVAKDLVDISQWNYRRGASPGIYEYGLGRLFGQFGQWPLNYIEYARKLATHSDKGEQLAAITRLALAHGAVLSAGNAAGVDTAQWVFTQPMAYGGGPVFSAVRNIPGSFDFETQRGAEARAELVRPIWPAPLWLPGGAIAGQLLDAINSDSPDVYKIMMGFKPMKAGEELKGEHGLLP